MQDEWAHCKDHSLLFLKQTHVKELEEGLQL